MNYNVVKGTRDFLPEQMNKRNYIFNTIKKVYQLHGFSQIETPALENLSTLMGKYGEEGDRLIYKVLNSGNFLEKIDLNKELDYKKVTNKISEKGLRYDLTVPFARFIVNNRNSITFPFKRYQIQPVWRADRPQKGRYREFYQCDADIIGSHSLLNEVELCEIIDEVFSLLGLKIELKINNRKILAAIAELIGKPDKIVDITIAIDKLEKIGYDKVIEELLERGLTSEDIEKINPILNLKGSIDEKIFSLKKLFSDSQIGQNGISELEEVFQNVKLLNLSLDLDFDITLARGLNYYTGAIFEVKCKDVKMGSIVGGGRYDNLTGVFGMTDVSGVGISFGADRIYDCLEELKLFPDQISASTTLIFANFGVQEVKQCLQYAKILRSKGIKTEIYPEEVKLQKQMKYANDKKIPYVALLGQKEIEEGVIVLKNMISGEQTSLTVEQIIDLLSRKL
ncbi:MAG: histidine--tRNA ligase [Bacteroidales bacterium]|nr:histidine--tRNA ligase [Bacteroidales bacterium]MDD2576401.1 histidine--tRNA ligase [Bacteroidales bacterium]MDD4067250.1 histidine--tRNA ligase [Bacteroidales bacterium]MDD4739467.1 histidine--tRNA ligase [Bacteroidales bacterium]